MNKDLLKKKLIPDSFNKEILDAVDVITYNKKNITFAGSFVRKSLRYSADIDIAEDFGKVKSSVIAGALQNIMHKILKHNDSNPENPYYLLDVKSGLNPKYIGKFKNLGEIKNGKVVGFDYKLVSEELKGTDIKPVKSFKSLSEYFEFREKIRKMITLRWSMGEILAGFKNLNGEHYPLNEAVKTFTTKLDMVFVCNGFYTEISNIFIDDYSSKHGLVFYPISPDVKHYEEAIKYNLMEYLDKHKYLKALKRMFIMALYKKDMPLLKKLFPVLLSDVGLLNKASSIIKTIISLYETNQAQDTKQIAFQLDNIKPLISNVYQFEFGEKGIDAEIDKVIHNLKNSKKSIKELEKLSDDLDSVSNRETLKLIQENHIKFDKKYLL
jgi:hypothetical protein